MYVGWNALCVSAYLEAAKVLELDAARHFALRSLDRILAEAWQPEQGLQHVIAYSDPSRGTPRGSGLLDDYAFTAMACLDAYEATADLSYFNFAQRIADKMVDLMFDPVSGGFFDTAAPAKDNKAAGRAGDQAETVSGFSDAGGKFRGRHRFTAAALPTPTSQLSQQSRADARSAGRDSPASSESSPPPTALRPSIFRSPHTQIVVIGDDEVAEQLYSVASSFCGFDKGSARS